MLSKPLISGYETRGCMYIYDSAVPQVIETVDTYHAVLGMLANACDNGTSFLASAQGNITNTADAAGLLRCTSASHGLSGSVRNFLTLVGMGDPKHNAQSEIQVVDPNTFDCTNIVYNSSGDSGKWRRGTSITILPGFDNIVSIDFSVSVSSAGNNKNYKFEMFKNVTELDEFVAEQKISVANDLVNLSSGGLVPAASGDVFWMAVMGTTDTTNCTFKHSNVHFHR
jgi:hypothetical protein